MDKATIITDKSDAAKLVANAEVLAHTLNVSRRRVYQLIDEGVLEKVGARFSFVKSVQNYIDFIRPDNQVAADLDEQLKGVCGWNPCVSSEGWQSQPETNRPGQ